MNSIQASRQAVASRLFAAAAFVLMSSTFPAVAQEASPAPDNVGAELAPQLTLEQALQVAYEDVEIAEGRDAKADDRTSEERQEAFTNARKRVTRVLQEEPLNIRAMFVRGRVALLAGRPRDAIADIEAYAADPVGQSDWLAHKLLGDLKLPSYAKLAQAHYRRALELAPNEAEVLIGLAQAALRLNQAQEAVDFAERAVRADADDAQYQMILSKAYLENKQFNEAVQTGRRAVGKTEQEVAKKPGDLGLLQELYQRYQQLTQNLTAAATTYPEETDFIIEYVHVMQDKADLERLLSYHHALSVIEGSLETMAPERPINLLLEQARLKHLLGLPEDAVEILDEVLEADPGNAAATELKRTIQGGA